MLLCLPCVLKGVVSLTHVPYEQRSAVVLNRLDHTLLCLLCVVLGILSLSPLQKVLQYVRQSSRRSSLPAHLHCARLVAPSFPHHPLLLPTARVYCRPWDF